MKTYLYLSLAAILYTLGFPNIFSLYIPFAPIIGISILIHIIFSHRDIRKNLTHYFYYNFIINILSFYWVTNTLQEFGKLPFIIAAIMNALFTFVFNPQFVVLIILLALIRKYFPSLERHYFKTGLFTASFAMMMTLIEYFIPQQFPVMLGQPWIIFSEFLGAASYLGLAGFTFMSFLLSFEIIKAKRFKKLSYINLLSILLFIFINPFLVKPESKDQEKLNIRLVQANISNFLKTDSESGSYASTAEVISRYEKLSTKDFEGQKEIDLTIWPETAYPFPIYTDKSALKKTSLPMVFHKIIDTTNSKLLIGGYDHYKDNPDGSFYQTEYNAALFINSNKELEKAYHKHILIPFGETLPLGPFKKWASTKIPEMAFFAKGESFPLFNLKDSINFISSICYEILRPEFFRSYLNNLEIRPQFMVNLTNDSWYGDTVEPEQHLFLARWRAIEFNLPILRSTNTGISTYIQRDGTELKRLAYNKTGNLDLEISVPKIALESDKTIYQIYGIMAIFPLWFLYFIFHLILIKLKHE